MPQTTSSPAYYRQRLLNKWASEQASNRSGAKANVEPATKRARALSLELLALTDEKRQAYEVRPWKEANDKQLQALTEACNNPTRSRRFDNIRRCRQEAMLFSSGSGGSVRPKSCHCRACATCQCARRYRLEKVFARKAKGFRQVKMVTLTLLHSDASLPEQCHRIKECFRRLRSRAVWKQLVRGGFWVIEITRNEEHQQWHVHIHACIDCKYLPHEWLRNQWQKVTGDSYIVWISAITPARSAYLAKYVSKGSSVASDSEALWNYYEAMNRSRDAQPFGDCGPLSESEASPRSTFVYCGIVSNIISSAQFGSSWAIELLPLLDDALTKSPHSPDSIETSPIKTALG